MYQKQVGLFLDGVFLCFVVLYLTRYLFQKKRFSARWIPVSPPRFLAAAFVWFILSAVFILLLGAQQLPLAFALSGGAVLAFATPVAALSCFTALLITRPWELMPENRLLTLIPRTYAVLCLAAFAAQALRRRELRIRWNALCTIYTLFLVWLFFSAVFSYKPAAGIEFWFDSFFPITVLAFLVFNSLEDKLDLLALQNSIVAAGTCVITSSLFFTLTSSGVSRLTGVGLLGNSNELGALTALVLPFTIFSLFLKGSSSKSWWFNMAASAILLLGLAVSQSRGAIMSLGLSGLLYFFACSRVIRRPFFAALLLLPLPVILLLSISRNAGEMAISTTSRWYYVVAGFNMLRSNPFFGVGIGNYPKFFGTYTPAFLEWGERSAHSTWVLAMAEGGLAGLLLFVLLVGYSLRQAWSIRFDHPQFFLSLASYIFAMSFLSHTYLFFPYLLMALGVAAARVYQQKAAASEPTVEEPDGERVAA